MSIIIDEVDSNSRYVKDSARVRTGNPKTDVLSSYQPDDFERDCINLFLRDFRLGWQTMHLPRAEFNDLSLYQRHVIDMLAMNTYIENDGQPLMEDRIGGWRSKAVRPIIRNKAISIMAHRTARLPVPKVWSYDSQNEQHEDAAKVMSYALDWAREQSGYNYAALQRELACMYSPISWGYTEYSKVYRQIKDKKVDGRWTYKQVLDTEQTGFKHIPLSTEQVFFGNFYEPDCQDQDFLIVRFIMTYDRAKTLYGQYANFMYVNPGVVTTLDDANKAFYNVYDPHQRIDEVEVLIRWRKSRDSKEIMINGVLITEGEAPNERDDHQYPLDKYYFLPINERCIAGKSLVFATQPDGNLINELYQMMIDGNKLNMFAPTVFTGTDKVGTDIMVPGLSLSLAEKDVKVNQLRVTNDQALRTSMEVSNRVEASVSESAVDPIQQGQQPTGEPSTAYEISRIEQNAATVMGLSMKFQIEQHIIPFGRLLLGDIIQYMTVGEVADIAGDVGLVYQSFYAKEPGRTDITNKVSFDANMPDEMDPKMKRDMSWALLKQAGGIKANMNIYKTNPELFRKFKYIFVIDDDVLNPRSTELDRAYAVELFNMTSLHPEIFDNKEVAKLLLETDPKARRDVDRFLAKVQPQMGMPPQGQMPGANTMPNNMTKPNAPVGASQLPQTFNK
jgi:hypothetical protein